MQKWIMLAVLALGTMFCSVNLSDPPTPTADVGAMVNATLTALAGSAAPLTVTPTPAPPTATSTGEPAAPTPTPTTDARSSFPETGYISGTLMYPSSFIPSLRIVAFPLDGSAPAHMDTALGQNSYTFELPVGTYHVVAYVLASDGVSGGLPGGYSQMVPCGLQAGCEDHTLITVTVTAGVTTTGVDPNDYYAPEDAFPPMPVP